MLTTISTPSFFESDHRNRLVRTTRKLGKVLGTTPRAQREPSSLSSSSSSSLYLVNSRDSTYSRATSAAISPPDSPNSLSTSNRDARRNSTAMSSTPSSDTITPRNAASSMHPTHQAKLEPQLKPTTQSKFKRAPSPVTALQPIASRSSDESSSISNFSPRLLPPVLYYKYNDDHLRQASSSQPHSSTIDLIPTTPSTETTPTAFMSPESEEPSEAERRRRKIDKLTRTLGEHIPTDLVFPDLSNKSYNVNDPDSPAKASYDPSRSKKEKSLGLARRASVSISAFTHLPSLATILRPSNPSSESSAMTSAVSTDASPRSNISGYRPEPEARSESRAGIRPETTVPPEMTRTTAFVQPRPPFLFTVEERGLEYTWDGERTPTTVTRAKSLSHSQPPHSPHRTHAHSLSETRSEAPFIDNPFNTNLLAPAGMEQSEEGLAVVRKERRQGWSGEWNRDDMQDVIKKLRSLK